MKIAILGWGSLIWEEGCLARHLKGKWKYGGPELPLEFSRKSDSRQGALTLVIDSEHGQANSTFFVTSSRRTLEKARLDLQQREKVPSVSSIGYTDLTSGGAMSSGKEVIEAIRQWAGKKGYDAVIWAALESNCDNFTLERAVKYLQELPPKGKKKAKEYIGNAPPEIDTPLRRALSEVQW
jgi:hypothetical protein